MKATHLLIWAMLLAACGGDVPQTGQDSDKGDTTYLPNYANMGKLLVNGPLDREAMADAKIDEQYCLYGNEYTTIESNAGQDCFPFDQNHFYVSRTEQPTQDLRLLAVKDNEAYRELEFDTEYWIEPGGYYAFMNNTFFYFQVTAKQQTSFECGRIGLTFAQDDFYKLATDVEKNTFASQMREELQRNEDDRTIIFDQIPLNNALNIMPGTYRVASIGSDSWQSVLLTANMVRSEF